MQPHELYKSPAGPRSISVDTSSPITRLNDGSVRIESDYMPDGLDTPAGQAFVEGNYSSLPTSEEARAMAVKIDPVNPALYANLHYFTQLDDRKGFTYCARYSDGREATITFDAGFYSTRDRVIVDSLLHDIQRPGGIGHIVRSITEQHYTSLINSANAYRNLSALGGTVSSTAADPHKAAVEERLRAQEAEIINLRKTVQLLGAHLGTEKVADILGSEPAPSRVAVTVEDKVNNRSEQAKASGFTGNPATSALTQPKIPVPMTELSKSPLAKLTATKPEKPTS